MKKAVFLSVIIVTGIAAVVFSRQAYTVPVLMYHSIDEHGDKSRLSVSAQTLEKQMRFLRRRNYEVLTLGEYVRLARRNEKPPRPAVVVTFDDGYENNYTCAYPILKKYRIPAAVFVVAGWVGNDNMLNWEQLSELSRSEIVTIGSHSLTHADLTKLEAPDLERELRESKRILESRLGTTVDFFCYPAGFFNPAVKEMVRAAGYRAACATHPGRETALNDVYAIRRIRVSQSSENLLIFWAQVSGYYKFFKDRRDKSAKKNSGY